MHVSLAAALPAFTFSQAVQEAKRLHDSHAATASVLDECLCPTPSHERQRTGSSVVTVIEMT